MNNRLIAVVSLLVILSGCVGDQRPLQLVSGAGPVYPAQAKAQGLQGDVVVRYNVTAQGVVVDAEVVSSNPPGIFDDAALEAVNSWRFNALVIDGVAQPSTGRQSTVSFRLDGADRYDDY
ncbi:MAG: energy transducer TonB [Pseudomonadaceae bacterium]|nr:energy transducer TonB [Pseudomonadaceae bacterium]